MIASSRSRAAKVDVASAARAGRPRRGRRPRRAARSGRRGSRAGRASARAPDAATRGALFGAELRPLRLAGHLCGPGLARRGAAEPRRGRCRRWWAATTGNDASNATIVALFLHGRRDRRAPGARAWIAAIGVGGERAPDARGSVAAAAGASSRSCTRRARCCKTTPPGGGGSPPAPLPPPPRSRWSGRTLRGRAGRGGGEPKRPRLRLRGGGAGGAAKVARHASPLPTPTKARQGDRGPPTAFADERRPQAAIGILVRRGDRCCCCCCRHVGPRRPDDAVRRLVVDRAARAAAAVAVCCSKEEATACRQWRPSARRARSARGGATSARARRRRSGRQPAGMWARRTRTSRAAGQVQERCGFFNERNLLSGAISEPHRGLLPRAVRRRPSLSTCGPTGGDAQAGDRRRQPRWRLPDTACRTSWSRRPSWPPYGVPFIPDQRGGAEHLPPPLPRLPRHLLHFAEDGAPPRRRRRRALPRAERGGQEYVRSRVLELLTSSDLSDESLWSPLVMTLRYDDDEVESIRLARRTTLARRSRCSPTPPPSSARPADAPAPS